MNHCDPIDDRAHAGQVLVVEDDADTREALCRVARLQGYGAVGVATVKAALANLSDRPACVILDLKLMDGSGLAVLEYVRATRLAIDVAVVTGVADGEMMADAVLMRPAAMFTKPVDLTEVAAWLKARAGAGSQGDDAGDARPGASPHDSDVGFRF